MADDGAAGGMMDLEEMDRRICGDLGKYKQHLIILTFILFFTAVEKNRRLDELFVSQTLDN